MSEHNGSSGTVYLELSRFQGHHLSHLLEDTIEQRNDQFHLETLLAAQDQVEDANLIATWLRENVALELESQQASQLLEVLQTRVGTSDSPSSRKETKILTEIRDRIAECLNGTSEDATSTAGNTAG